MFRFFKGCCGTNAVDQPETNKRKLDKNKIEILKEGKLPPGLKVYSNPKLIASCDSSTEISSSQSSDLRYMSSLKRSQNARNLEPRIIEQTGGSSFDNITEDPLAWSDYFDAGLTF